MSSIIIDDYLSLLERYESVVNKKEERVLVSEQLVDLLPSFISVWEFEFGETPSRFSFRDYLLDTYLKDGLYHQALNLLERACFDHEAKEKHRIRVESISAVSLLILPVIAQKPGMFESEIISHLGTSDLQHAQWFLEFSHLIQHVHSHAGVRYWLKNQDISRDKEVNNNTIDGSSFDGWYISISFYPTNSKKFEEVLHLAQAAPQFIECKDSSSRLFYQAAYSSMKDEFLSFSKLFKLTKDWKTCEIAVNGTKIDTKLFAPIIECYETKLHSSEAYCFGTDEQHQNPFGCHKLGLTQKNEPWWFYGNFDSKNIWHVNKKAILGEVKSGMKLCRFCPAFSENKTMEVYESIPSEIDSDEDPNWYRSGYSIRPVPGKDPLSS